MDCKNTQLAIFNLQYIKNTKPLKIIERAVGGVSEKCQLIIEICY